MKTLALCLLTLCLVSSPWGLFAQNATIPVTNPAGVAVQHNLRLAEIPIHDPWILAYAPTKTYYLYTSNNAHITGVSEPGTMAYRS
jgi:hypothetical protein